MAIILVVEDEIDICNLIRSELESEGHTVHQAFDGHAALLAVEQHHPQLVILDWMLPKLDGLSVCRRIRQNHLVPIIMLTARSEEVDRILGLEVGADDYISKPFSVR
jgi:DNA-binding response OmpR family regulator